MTDIAALITPMQVYRAAIEGRGWSCNERRCRHDYLPVGSTALTVVLFREWTEFFRSICPLLFEAPVRRERTNCWERVFALPIAQWVRTSSTRDPGRAILRFEAGGS
ncbi:hypothetical protein [Nocardia rhamnosiphila]